MDRRPRTFILPSVLVFMIVRALAIAPFAAAQGASPSPSDASPSDAGTFDAGPSGAGPSNAAARAMLADEAPYLAQNDAAMTKMMHDMTVQPTGDVDRDFVAMMVPHHQGAIDMAEAILRYGHNEQLRRLAQEIIVTQQQEIAAMRLAVGEPLPPSVPSPTQPPPTLDPSSMPHRTTPMSPENMSPDIASPAIASPGMKLQ